MDPTNISAGSISLAPMPVDNGSAVQMEASENISIMCYENEVPSFVEAELERLYGHIFSSLLHYKTYGGLPDNTSTYVVRKNNRIAALFLFQRERRQVRVFNEGIRLDDEEAGRFTDYIFNAYQSVGVIAFHAVQSMVRRLPFPHQQFDCTEDIVLALPDSSDAYLASLGKSTRSYIRRYENKLRRSFPSFRLEVQENNEVNEQDIRDIVRLNRIRMAEKDKVSSNDDEETERIITLAKACGVVCVARIDGRICGGVINYRIGSHYFMPVIAHDPQYNDYRLGTICCFLTICECIARGCKVYHFMWGRYEYKYRLGGVQQDLQHLAVYRSRLRYLLNADAVLKIAAASYVRDAKQWLQHRIKHPEQGGLVARIAINLLNDLQTMKRIAARLLRRE